MRLDEYSKPIIPKKFYKTVNDSYVNKKFEPYEMKDKLETLGWYETGKGAYSDVYENKNKPYVLKLNTSPDSAYNYYVQSIKKYHNKHFPKISDLKFMELGGKRYYIYLIETLLPIDGAYGGLEHMLVRYLEKIMINPSARISDFAFPEREKNYFKKNPDLVKAARIVGKNKLNYKGEEFMYLDIHFGNIMKRNDGTIVITDPYV